MKKCRKRLTNWNQVITCFADVYQKSELLGTNFESPSPLGSPAPTCNVTGLKTGPASTDFAENSQKLEKQPDFIQNHSESLKLPVSERFNWADDSYLPPTSSATPTKHPHNFSALHSSSTNPFLSLRRHHRHIRKIQIFLRPLLGLINVWCLTPVLKLLLQS